MILIQNFNFFVFIIQLSQDFLIFYLEFFIFNFKRGKLVLHFFVYWVFLVLNFWRVLWLFILFLKEYDMILQLSIFSLKICYLWLKCIDFSQLFSQLLIFCLKLLINSVTYFKHLFVLLKLSKPLPIFLLVWLLVIHEPVRLLFHSDVELPLLFFQVLFHFL